MSTQPQFMLPIPPKTLASSLVAWLDRSRIPAIFQDDVFWSHSSCRRRLKEYVDSWISSGYRLDSWTRRGELEAAVRFATLNVSQANDEQVQTTIIWGKHIRQSEPEEPDSGKYVSPTPHKAELAGHWEQVVLAHKGEQKAAEIF